MTSEPRAGVLGRSARRFFYTLRGVICVGLALSRTARADEGSAERARAAYDAGASAYNEQDFRSAAEQFARADELVQNQAVLKLALAAAVRAEDPVLSMNLVQRAERRATTDPGLLELVRVTRARFESQVGFVEVRCTSSPTCQAYLADQRVEPGVPVAVQPGTIELRFGEGRSASRVSVTVGVARTLEVPEPAPVPGPAARPAPAKLVVPEHQRFFLDAAPESASFRLPRGVFWGGAALTGALVVVTVASGIDARHAHEQFLGNRTEETRSHGLAAAERTNVLLGATLGTAALTGAIGLFFTQWSGGAAHGTSQRVPSLTLAF